jgi:hypothetical protein
MRTLCIALVVAGTLTACRNGSNNARDTTGMTGGASGSVVPTTDTGSAANRATMPATQPTMGTPTLPDSTKRDTLTRKRP